MQPLSSSPEASQAAPDWLPLVNLFYSRWACLLGISKKQEKLPETKFLAQRNDFYIHPPSLQYKTDNKEKHNRSTF